MTFPRFLAAGVFISVLLHGAGSAYFAKDPNEVLVAASKGGSVSVIGSIEDLVAGNPVETVEVTEPVEEVKPVEEPVELVKPPVETQKIEPVDTAKVEPVETVKAVQPASVSQPKQIEPVETVVADVSVPVIAGVTSIEQVTAEDQTEEIEPEEAKPAETPAPKEHKPVEPVSAAKPITAVEPVKPDSSVPEKPETQKPVEIAKAEPQKAVEPLKPVLQQPEVLQPVPEPFENVTKTPVAKPEPPVKKTVQRKKKKKKPVKKAQKKGSKTNARKGGERVTSKTARSNANGRADAKTNDGGTKAKSNYKGRVVAKLRRAKKYPSAARSKKLRGTVRVSFTISKNGSVSGIRVSRSSGHAILDKAALAMVRRASPMPKFPKDIRLAKMRLQVPVRFDR